MIADAAFHAAPVEVVFTLVSAIGFVLRSWALNEARKDLHASHGQRSVLRWIALRDVVGETTGLIVKAAFVGLGVWAMMNPANQPPRPGLFSTVAGIVLVGVVVLWDTNSALSAVIRRRVREETEDE